MGSSCCLIRPKSMQDTDITHTSVFIKHSTSSAKIRKRITIDDDDEEKPDDTIPSVSWITSRDEYKTIVDLFDRYEAESSGDDWKHETLPVQHIQAWCNYKGSHLNSDYPCLKIKWTYEHPVLGDWIIRAIYSQERPKWDDKVEEVITVRNDDPNTEIVIIRNFKVLLVEARQFIEKRIILRDIQEGDKKCIYVFISSLPEDQCKELEQKYAKEKTKYVLCETIFTVMKITYDPSLKEK